MRIDNKKDYMSQHNGHVQSGEKWKSEYKENLKKGIFLTYYEMKAELDSLVLMGLTDRGDFRRA